MRRLLIVESSTKAKTIQKYLGEGYTVVATAGHFRDLPERELGVDLGTFAPSYVLDPKKSHLLATIRSAVRTSDEVYLATDADREGEAISWHLVQVFGLGRAKRIRFTEITPRALQRAVAAAGPLDQHLVDAALARRVLDRLVGYQVSPLLKVFGANHSAGRVQSATLHLVAQRETSRELFTPEPYWTLSAHYREGFVAQLVSADPKGALAQARLPSEAAARAIQAEAQAAPHQVQSVEAQEVERAPKAPFVTSTLQQAASVLFGLKPKQVMAIAQGLFEQGLISYHRTDSVALSEEAIEMAREFIGRDFLAALPEAPVRYAPKAHAQGAHEAIRPVRLSPWLPDDLEGDAALVYELIRNRFVACQCKPARLLRTTAVIAAGPHLFRAVGEELRFDGFLRYARASEDDEQQAEGERARLPALKPGLQLGLPRVEVARKETRPPPRFTRASLIREMERLGIGRPATYAQGVEVLFERGYLAEEERAVYPTPRGRLVDRALARAFRELVSSRYSADLEAKLDQVARGARAYQDELRAFWRSFSLQLVDAPQTFAEVAADVGDLQAIVPDAPAQTGKSCPRCGCELYLRRSSSGEFFACSAPRSRCGYAGDLSAKPSALPCPSCKGAMEEIQGQWGPYARCLSKGCPGRRDLAPLTAEPCPICQGPMRDKGYFLSCAKWPSCSGSRHKPGARRGGPRPHHRDEPVASTPRNKPRAS